MDIAGFNTAEFDNMDIDKNPKSFFQEQYTEFLDNAKEKIQRKNYISIDSRFRNRVNNVISNNIDSREDFLWAIDGFFYILITTNNLINQSTINSNKTINFIITRSNQSVTRPLNIGGVSSDDILFNFSTLLSASLWL